MGERETEGCQVDAISAECEQGGFGMTHVKNTQALFAEWLV